MRIIKTFIDTMLVKIARAHFIMFMVASFNLVLSLSIICVMNATDEDKTNTMKLIIWLIAIWLVDYALCYKALSNSFSPIIIWDDFLSQADSIYLWGFSLSNILDADLSKRLGKYRGSGFCHEFAAAIMFALKENKTAQLCHGIDPEYGRHSWVEYRAHGCWWVIDTTWIKNSLPVITRTEYRRMMKEVKIEKTCKYQEFWQGPYAECFYRILIDSTHQHQDEIFCKLEIFHPAYNYGFILPDENGKIHPIKDYRPAKETKDKDEFNPNKLTDRNFIKRLIDDPSLYTI